MITDKKVNAVINLKMDGAGKVESDAKATARALGTLGEAGGKAVKPVFELGKAFDELRKGMANAALHKVTQELHEGLSKATDGVLDLNSAMAGSAFGPWGFAIGLVGGSLLKLGALGGPIDQAKRMIQEQDASAVRGALAMLKLNEAVHAQYGVLGKANEQLRDYNNSLHQLELGLGSISKALPDVIGMLTGRGLGVDAWNPSKSKDKLAKIFAKPSGPESDAARARRLRRGVGDQFTESIETGSSRGSSIFGTGGQSRADENRDEFGNERAFVMPATQKLTEDWFATIDKLKGQPTVLERMFGKVEEIDGYREAFSLLTGVATTAYDALVDGNISAGQAVKQFVASAIKGFGAKMLVRSLEEGAEGFAALASYNYPSAALHFKSAALFAGGAVAAGLVAHTLGSGGGGGGAGGGASAGGAGGGYSPGAPSYASGTGPVSAGYGNTGSGPITIIETNPFNLDDTPRMKRNKVNRFNALGGQVSGSGVSF